MLVVGVCINIKWVFGYERVKVIKCVKEKFLYEILFEKSRKKF